MEDLANSVGATVLGPAGKQSLAKVDVSHLGSVKVCEAKKNWATFVGGAGDMDVIDEKIEQLKAEIDQTDSLKECERIQTRVNRLASGVAIIKIGGSTEVEMMEAFHRAEDALQAVKSAQDPYHFVPAAWLRQWVTGIKTKPAPVSVPAAASSSSSGGSNSDALL